MEYTDALKTAARVVADLTDAERQALREHPETVLTLASHLNTPAPTTAPRRTFKDADGDVWDEIEPDKFSMRRNRADGPGHCEGDPLSFEGLQHAYGPLTEIV